SEKSLWAGLFAGHAAAGRSRGLCDALARRFGRRIPGRKPRANVDAAAIKAAVLLRLRHRGRDRAAGPDPGRHGASLSAAPRRHREGTLPIALARPWTAGRTARGSQTHAWRAAVSGTSDADRDYGGEIHAGRSGRTAPRHGHVPPYRQRPSVSRQI